MQFNSVSSVSVSSPPQMRTRGVINGNTSKGMWRREQRRKQSDILNSSFAFYEKGQRRIFRYVDTKRKATNVSQDKLLTTVMSRNLIPTELFTGNLKTNYSD